MKSSEAVIILDKILNEDLLLNNANVSLLQEFAALWTNAAIREGIFYKFLQNWLEKVHLLHQQRMLKNGTCIVTVFILEMSLNEIDLDHDSRYYSVFSQTFVPFHKLVVSACMTNVNEITSSNDAVIAFFRLHCSLSRKTTGIELIRKYNLWKQLLSFYFKSNKFNFFIQNSCTEYINNLISAELPNELISFLEVLNATIQCIKNSIEDHHPLCDGVVYRSLRITYHILSKYLINLNSDCLRLVSKRGHSLEPYIRHLLITSKDEIIVSTSLKIFTLLRIFLFNVKDIKNDDEIFHRFVATVFELLSENEKFHRHMPEIFTIRLEGTEGQSKLRMCSVFLQVRTIVEYLKHLHAAFPESVVIDLHIPESEVFTNFFQLYCTQLCKQNHLATITSNILKNFSNEKQLLDEDTRIYLVRSLGSILKLFSHNERKLGDEINNILLNIMHALSTPIVKREFLKDESIFSELLDTSIRVARRDLQYPIILRLSAFKLSRILLQEVTNLSDENINSLRAVIVQGLHDPYWEVRDSALEILNEILVALNFEDKESILANDEIPKSLSSKLKDEESFVRATAYAVLTVTFLPENKSLWEMYFDYGKLLEETNQNFQNETEGDVREKMIEFIIEGWRSFKISDSVLLTAIYETIYNASTNDLHSEVRRNGMVFWKTLVNMLKRNHASQNRRSIVEFLEKLSFIGCLQAIINGIEDEYDTEVMKTAVDAVHVLKSLNLTVNDFCTPESGISQVSINDQLLNKLPSNNSTKLDFLDARQFVSTYIDKESNYSLLGKPIEGNEFDINDLLKCFADANFNGGEINEKDCY